MATQAECVNIIQTECERLQQYLTALPPDAWTQPSACALWEVRDVVAHLIRNANAYTGHITRALRDDTSPPPGGFDPTIFKTHSPEERRQWVRALAQRPLANRGRFGNDLVSAFSHAWDPFPRFLAALSIQEWHKPCFHSFGIIPVHSLVHGAVSELAIHSWDIRSALEPSVPLSPDVLAAMLDLFAECPHWFFVPGARLPTPLRYRFTFTGRLNRPWDIVVEGETAHMGPAADATPAHVTFACELEHFVLLMCGRMSFDAALGDKRVIPTGDMAGVQAFKQWFQGV